jgi:hypothetical protein
VRKHRSAIGLIALGVTAALGPGAVLAEDTLATCAQIQADAQRLACYDGLAGYGASGTRPHIAATTPAVPIAAAPATAVATAAANPVADFGLLPPAIKQRDPENWVESITAQVKSVTRNAEDRLVITLDNGQVWAQSETKPSAVLKPGDLVRIKRAALGSFMLVGPRSVSSRVRRVR